MVPVLWGKLFACAGAINVFNLLGMGAMVPPNKQGGLIMRFFEDWEQASLPEVNSKSLFGRNYTREWKSQYIPPPSMLEYGGFFLFRTPEDWGETYYGNFQEWADFITRDSVFYEWWKEGGEGGFFGDKGSTWELYRLGLLQIVSEKPNKILIVDEIGQWCPHYFSNLKNNPKKWGGQ